MRLIFAFLLTLLPLFVASAQGGSSPVSVDRVTPSLMLEQIPAFGRLVALQSGPISARTDGPVAEVLVEVGDRVAAGDTLVRLDPRRLAAREALERARLVESQATLASAQARLELADKELSRMTRLRGTSAYNEAAHDAAVREQAAATAELNRSRAAVMSAEASLELRAADRADSAIRAPFPGVVVARQVSAGAWLRPGDPVATLVNDAALEIDVDVPASVASALVAGTEIPVSVAGKRLTARLRAVVPDENPATRTRRLRLVPALEPSTRRFAINQAVTLWVPVGAAPGTLSVHKDAVVRGPQSDHVFVVADGVAEAREVELGRTIGERLEVLSGLANGELVVVRGNERLRAGQQVQISNEDTLDTEGEAIFGKLPTDTSRSWHGKVPRASPGSAT